jgi:hypothetical protein
MVRKPPPGDADNRECWFVTASVVPQTPEAELARQATSVVVSNPAQKKVVAFLIAEQFFMVTVSHCELKFNSMVCSGDGESKLKQHVIVFCKKLILLF